jgi:hypothetical protein
LEWDHPVRKAHKGRHDGTKHHNQTVHGGELVEQLRIYQLQTRLKELGTNAQGQNTTEHQHGEAEQQVQRSNVFVVGGIHPTTPPGGGVVVVIVMGVIVGVKYGTHAGFLVKTISKIVKITKNQRAALISAGCTNWPVLLDQLFLV